MGNENYREAFENDRQEISLNSESSLSRRAQRNAAKQKPKENKSLLLPVLFFIFILIPVMVLIYVAFLYEPTEPITEASPNNEVSVETNTASTENPQLAAADDEEENEEQAEEEAKAKAEEEAALKQEQAAKAAEEREAEEKAAAAKAEVEAEAAEKAQAQKVAAEKAAAEKAQAEKAQAEKAQAEKAQAEKAQAEELKRKQEQEAAEKKAQEAQQQTPSPSKKTHVVQPNETLYRIAVNNYGAAGAGAAVERIKQANGLSSNEISVGQALVLP